MKKNISVILIVSMLILSLAGCGAVSSGAQITETESVQTAQSETLSVRTQTEEEYGEETAIDLDTIDGELTISEEGTYVLSGSLNGRIVIDAPEDAKVKLVLDGAAISAENTAAIYAIEADKLVIETAAGSKNTVNSSGTFVQTDDNNVDAAIFAKCDLTLKGEGLLTVNCDSCHGVVSKDDLKVKGGTLVISAAGQGLSGKDSVTVEDGEISIVSGTDGIQSSNAEDTEKGIVTVVGGSIDIAAGSDGVDAANALSIEGGSLNVEAGNGKGLKAENSLAIVDGSVSVSSYDDALHSNGSVTVSGGNVTLASADDGIHADLSVAISGGTVAISESYEGIEAQTISIEGGETYVAAKDDGLNASSGSGSGNAFGGFGGGAFDSDSSCTLTISGGTLIVNAGGDGLDSNGALVVTGGEAYISGPTNSGNGALDYGMSASISGGIVIAAGSVGMAENFGSASTQGSMLLNLSSAVSAGTTITVSDASGNVLASYAPEKSFQSVVISAPGIEAGETYTVTIGSYSTEITMSSTIYGSGSGMGMGMGGQNGGPGMGGGFGGQGGFGGMGGFGGGRP